MRGSRLAGLGIVLSLTASIAISLRSERPVADGAPAPVVARMRSHPITSAWDSPATTGVDIRVEQATPRAEPLVVVDLALQGWGRFGVDGDLTAVEPWYDHGGPQWDRFETESHRIAALPPGPPPYRVWMEGAAVCGRGLERRVTGTVRFARTGEPTQTFRWTVVLVRSEGGWRVWTVEEAG